MAKAGIEQRRGRGLLHGQLRPRRRQRGAPGGPAGRPADHHLGRDRQPLLLLGPADHRHGRQLRAQRRRRRGRGRRRGVDLPARHGRRQEQLRPGADQDRTRRSSWPMIDTADIVAERYKRQPRIPGRILAGEPAAHGRRPAGRQVQGRDRPDEDQDEGGQQGDEGRVHRRLRGRPRRVQPARHHRRGPGQAGARQGPGQVHHRRQRLAALRRRRRRGDDGSQGSRSAAAWSPWASSRAGPSPAASPTRWASARCSPSRACWNATA